MAFFILVNMLLNILPGQFYNFFAFDGIYFTDDIVTGDIDLHYFYYVKILRNEDAKTIQPQKEEIVSLGVHNKS
ncbi:hypothetical protein [Psychromonas ingrahamii]|uniref:hypothetical protein n=1 Tax=Psychromonas ingrahamii TaxID=357794 RepID=UPI000309B8BB|nr:hypothetical protein [Psychromonas ingrahamii]